MISNTATVSDPKTGDTNDSSTDSTTVRIPGLTLDKTAPRDHLQRGRQRHQLLVPRDEHRARWASPARSPSPTTRSTVDLSGGHDGRQPQHRPRPRREHDVHGVVHDHPGRPQRRFDHEHRDRDGRRASTPTSDSVTVTAVQTRALTLVKTRHADDLQRGRPGHRLQLSCVTQHRQRHACPGRSRSATTRSPTSLPERQHGRQPRRLARSGRAAHLHRLATPSPRPTSNAGSADQHRDRHQRHDHVADRRPRRSTPSRPAPDRWSRRPLPTTYNAVGQVIAYSYLVTQHRQRHPDRAVHGHRRQGRQRDLPGHRHPGPPARRITCTASRHHHPGRPQRRLADQHRDARPTARPPRRPTPRRSTAIQTRSLTLVKTRDPDDLQRGRRRSSPTATWSRNTGNVTPVRAVHRQPTTRSPTSLPASPVDSLDARGRDASPAPPRTPSPRPTSTPAR